MMKAADEADSAFHSLTDLRTKMNAATEILRLLSCHWVREGWIR